MGSWKLLPPLLLLPGLRAPRLLPAALLLRVQMQQTKIALLPRGSRAGWPMPQRQKQMLLHLRLML